MGYPNTSSAVVQPNPLDRVHGLTSCEPTPAPNPRVELTLTRSFAALPNQMSESEMGLTLPESSVLTRRAGRPNTTPRLEMSPTKGEKGPFTVFLETEYKDTAFLWQPYTKRRAVGVWLP